ncbi:MAG: drug/metabolite exporter YedA [Gaiellaceae bacterium]|nr:MAG: drug/metabolite exporter YedA [Gaiellaceae bacterium]
MTAPARHVWAALLVVYVVWGSTYFGIKVVVETMPPLFSAAMRFLVAAALLAAFLRARGTSLRVSRPELAGTSLVGLLLLAVGVGVVHVAEQTIDSSVAAMIVGTVPLQIIVMRTLAGESPARATQLSTLAGLGGLLLVVAPGLGDRSTALGLALMVGASISWSSGSFVSRRLRLPRDPLVASVWEMGAGAAFLSVGALAAGELGTLAPAAFSARSLAAWAYLVVVGSLVGFTAYAWLLRVAPISLVVTHQYVNPLVAIALGMLLLGERPSPWSLAGAALVVASVYVAVRAESAEARGARPAPVAPRGTRADPTASGSPSGVRR